MTNRAALLYAFAFAVMADPVSSVAYAIEASLRALRGGLALQDPRARSDTADARTGHAGAAS
jgi:hypothetical protein